MKPGPQVWVSGVKTIYLMPFSVPGEGFRMELMPYLQIREARLPGKGVGMGTGTMSLL